MEDKTLKNKAIKIKGNDYVLVSDRIKFFNDNYQNGSIDTFLISKPEDDMVIMKATVTPDSDKRERTFTGYSQAKWGDGIVNTSSAIENCETSAVGRALGMMGIGVIDSVASVDEMRKAGVKEDQEDKQPEHWCDVHKTGMKINRNGKPFHMKNGEFCNGRGFPSDPRPTKPVTKKDVMDTLSDQVADEIPF